jgi:hypothetical protein
MTDKIQDSNIYLARNGCTIYVTTIEGPGIRPVAGKVVSIPPKADWKPVEGMDQFSSPKYAVLGETHYFTPFGFEIQMSGDGQYQEFAPYDLIKKIT